MTTGSLFNIITLSMSVIDIFWPVKLVEMEKSQKRNPHCCKYFHYLCSVPTMESQQGGQNQRGRAQRLIFLQIQRSIVRSSGLVSIESGNSIRAERAATGLNAAGENITDNLVIAMILKGLPEEYKPFVVVHTQIDKVKTLTEFKAAVRTYASTEASRSSVQHTVMSVSYTHLTLPTTPYV